MGKVFCGVSGWAYAKWKPDFYPAKLASTKFLGYYSGRLNSVEVNYTFRGFPTEKLLGNWISATPPDFKFAIKAHQSITHIKRLKNVRRRYRKIRRLTKTFARSKQTWARALSAAAQSKI